MSRVEQVVQMVCASHATAAAHGVVALPFPLTSAEAREVEAALRARGVVAPRYVDEPRVWDLLARAEAILGLDDDEPRVEWGGRG